MSQRKNDIPPALRAMKAAVAGSGASFDGAAAYGRDAAVPREAVRRRDRHVGAAVPESGPTDPIYPVSDELYAALFVRLAEAIDARSYFSGTIAFRYGAAECRFTASLIVYRARCSLPEGEAETLVDLVPVWWELHTTVGGEERLNDFSFAELRRRIG